MKPACHSEARVAAIAPVAKQIAAVQNEMRAQGLFANDRELLECQGCRLKEGTRMQP